MKLFKKLVTVFLAIMTIFCIAAFAACDFTQVPEPPPSQEKPDGSENEKPDGEEKPEEEKLNINSVIEGISGKTLDYLDGNFTIDTTVLDKFCQREMKSTLSGKAKFNGADGNADIVTKDTYTDTDSQGNPVNQTHIYHSFLRDWKVYLYGANEGEEDILEEYPAESLEDYGDVSDHIYPANPNLLVKYAPRHNYTLLMLARETGNYDIENDKISIDVNATLYNLKTVIDSFIDNAKNTDTVGKILTDPLVVNYFKAVLNVADPVDLPEILSWFGLDGNEQGLIDALMAVPADENSTTYEYLLKLIKSDEAYDAVNKYLAENFEKTLPAKIEDITLQFIADLVTGEANTDFDEVKRSLKQEFDGLLKEITADKAVYESNDYFAFETDNGMFISCKQSFEVSDTEIIYTVKDNKIVSEKISGNLKIIYSTLNSEEQPGDGDNTEEATPVIYSLETYKISATANFLTEAYTPVKIPTQAAN